MYNLYLNEKEIVAIREQTRIEEKNPACCGEVSIVLSDAIDGASEFFGAYRMADGTVCDDHAWVDLPNGAILDATVDQFGEGENIRISIPGDKNYDRYLRI